MGRSKCCGGPWGARTPLTPRGAAGGLGGTAAARVARGRALPADWPRGTRSPVSPHRGAAAGRAVALPARRRG